MRNLTRRQTIGTALAGSFAARTTTAQTPNATPMASPVASPSSANGVHCGINYDVGSELTRGFLTRPKEHSQFFRDEITAIRDRLHTNQIGLFGSEPDTIIEALNIAAEAEMDVKVQTRLNFIEPPQMLERLLEVATEAERLRTEGVNIVLDVGCEYMLFAEGMIPGDDALEKIDVINRGEVDWEQVFTTLFGMLAGLAGEARNVFGGPITYSDTPMEAELWDPFDIITIDHYLSTESAPTYLNVIHDLVDTGKPVWIGEFGATASSGAPQDGGMSWDAVDYEADPPQIIDGVVSDEAAQAEAIFATLQSISDTNAERAYLYEFITPDAPFTEDPRFNWDVTAYGIVKVQDEEGDQPYASTGFWEPKEAFHTIAEWNKG